MLIVQISKNQNAFFSLANLQIVPIPSVKNYKQTYYVISLFKLEEAISLRNLFSIGNGQNSKNKQQLTCYLIRVYSVINPCFCISNRIRRVFCSQNITSCFSSFLRLFYFFELFNFFDFFLRLFYFFK